MPLDSSTSVASNPANRESHIPRPRNPFIIFRSHWRRRNCDPSVKHNHQTISRLAGQAWKALLEEEKAPFRCQAENIKRQHAIDFPGYQYRPRSGPYRRKRVIQNSRVGKAKCDKIDDQFFRQKRKGALLANSVPKPVPSPLCMPSPVFSESSIVDHAQLSPTPSASTILPEINWLDVSVVSPDAGNETTCPTPVDDFIRPNQTYPCLNLLYTRPSPNVTPPVEENGYKPYLIFNAPYAQLSELGPIVPFEASLKHSSGSMFSSAPSPYLLSCVKTGSNHVDMTEDNDHGVSDVAWSEWLVDA
ncbi:hypothetical protein D9757_002176 [Collybiopsis confluens]|uniref:HMG box domain-containing protein n=1 Tax=Collybiopsis confluens TaxID=2823264 RepID=A0A8H5HZV0_9AGAR|nr:hypothetical protein D9757_002176 [Collybiopsis confluens]